MRLIGTMLLGVGIALPLAPAQAAEKAAMLRASELKERPAIDAPTLAKLAAKQSITIVKRQGPWANVETGGKTGWVRTLSFSLATGTTLPGARSRSASLLHTGSSGTTATTGVKGMDEEDIKAASPNYVELQLLGTLGVPADQAAANAKQSGLSEHQVDYLKERGK
jgi:hypothetical protein